MPLKKVEVAGGVPEGGYEYTQIETPDNVTFPFTSCDEHSAFSDGIVYYTAFIPAESIRVGKLPLDPNPRKPMPNALVTGGIQMTLANQPDRFHHRNNGMTIVANNVLINPSASTVELGFIDGDGICNGGHTYLGIENFPATISPDALVRCEIVLIPNSVTDRHERILEIARYRNMNNKLKAETEANYLGHYEDFKEILGDRSKHFIWFEGDPDADYDSGAQGVKHLIRLMGSFDPKWFEHPLTGGSGGSHRPNSNSTATPHTKWFDSVNTPGGGDYDLRHISILMPEMLQTMDYVRWSLKNDDFSALTTRWKASKLWQYAKEEGDDSELKFIPNGHPLYGEKGYRIPDRLEQMIIGGFRKNIWFSVDSSDETEYLGFIMHPVNLWKRQGLNYMRELYATMKAITNSGHAKPIVAFNGTEACFRTQLASLEFGADSNIAAMDPYYVIHESTGDRFIMEDDPKEVTHHMKIIAGTLLKEINMVVGPSSSGETEYRKL